MPICIPDQLPAKQVLQGENIFVMDEDRAVHQDIRPLKIAILNLMPTKIATETQLLRLLGNTPLQVEVTLVRTNSHDTRIRLRSTSWRSTRPSTRSATERFDALIITGRAGGTLAFRESGLLG